LKDELREKCEAAGKPDVVIRIACHELESWYLADLAAVERGLELGALSSRHKKYDPADDKANAYQELRRITEGKYQEIQGSRKIGRHLDLDNRRSRSFAVFMNSPRSLLASP
jgi:hypothetical protein